MKRNKKNMIITIVSLILIISGSFLLILCLKKPKAKEKKENNFNGFTFKEVKDLEYGNFTLSDFVEGINCNKVCTYNNEKIDYNISEVKNLGENEVTVTVHYLEKEYSHSYKVKVNDTTLPVLNFKTEDFTVVKNSEFDPKNIIDSAIDNYDGDLTEKVKTTGIINTKKVGDYKVIYEVSDSNENKLTKEVVFHVLEEENSTTNNKPNTNNTNNTNNKPNTNNNNSNNVTNTGTGFKDKVNKVSLKPTKTRFPNVDNKVGSIINSKTNSSMSNYDKLVAIYDYVKNTLSYEMSVLDYGTVSNLVSTYHYTSSDAIQVYNAYYSLETNAGVCDNYSAMFMVLARRLGFEAYVIGGEAPSQKGGRNGHAWVTIKIDGTYYFFDPQIEDYSKTKYNYFGKTESEMKNFYSNYSISSSVNDFNYFREIPEVKVDILVSGSINTEKSLASYSTNKSEFQTSAKLNDKINIKVTFKGTNANKYKIYTDKSTLKEGTTKGGSITFDYTFDTAGTEQIFFNITDGNTKVKYTLTAYVE